MDQSQFDRLTRELGKSTSRRTMVKSILGLAGVLVASRHAGRAEAARRGYSGPSLPFEPSPVCLDGYSWNGATCECHSGVTCGSACCDAGETCLDGSCVVPPPQCPVEMQCGSLCCDEGTVCMGDSCAVLPPACPAEMQCGSLCCSEGTVCTNGACVPQSPSCPNGQEWDGSECSCIAGATCGTTCCADGTTCSSGVCIPNPGCFPLGQTCTRNSDCCTALCIESVCRVRPGGSGGCFVGETRIAMADGTSRPVADITEGDLVLGADGRVNRVLAIDRLLIEDRLLYGLNGSAAFVTASHPFMTDDGWKAIDPADSYLDHRVPAVGRLTVGDRLVQLSGVLAPAGAQRITDLDTPLEIQTESVSLLSMTGVVAPASTPLYNLRLDGNHTYFANDLLVHNKIFLVKPHSSNGIHLG